MKKKLRFLSLLISVIMIIQSFVVIADSEEATIEEISTDISMAISKDEEVLGNILSRLGIVTELEFIEGSITKGAYLGYILNMLKIPLVPAEEQLFFDVPLTSSYANIINTAYVTKLITGDASGFAGADNPLKLSEGIIIAIRALNATGMTPHTGDTYLSYMQTASKLNLYDGLEGVNDETPLTNEQVFRLIYNTLTSKYMTTLNGIDLNLVETSILKTHYKIYKTKGLVESCHYGNIYGESVAHKGDVVIEDVTFRYDDDSSRELLGKNVVLYYSKQNDDGVPVILYMYESGNDIIELDAEDITSHKGTSLKYVKRDSDKSFTVSLASKAITLVNGDRTVVPSSGLAIPKHGDVTLVDNNRDGKYDIILYTKYEIAISTGVSTTQNQIYSQKGTYKAITLDDYDEYRIMDTEGNILTITDITKDDVLNIRESKDKRYIEIIVCRQTLDLVVASVWDEGYGKSTFIRVEGESGNSYLTVSDFELLTDDNAILVSDSISAYGKKYTFALDTDGKLAAILDWSETGLYHYGYMLAAYAPSMGKSYVRLVSDENQVIVVNVAKKVRVVTGNKSQTVTAKQYVDGYAKEGLIRYKLNADGELNAVELPQVKSAGATSGLREALTLPPDLTNDDAVKYYTTPKLVGGKMPVNANTKVFYIPDEAHQGDVDYYSVGSIADFTNGQMMPGTILYKYDDDAYADVMVTTYFQRFSDHKDGTIVFVSGLYRTVDASSGIEYDAVKVIDAGSEATYMIDPTFVYEVDKNYTVGEGDVIRIIKGIDGKITGIAPIYDYDKDRIYGYDKQISEAVFGNDGMNIMGPVNDIIDGVYLTMKDAITTATDGSATYTKDNENMYYISSSTKIYQYNKEAVKNKASVITVSDIPTYVNDPATTSKALVITRTSTLNFIILYK